jgi:hypothetical protein
MHSFASLRAASHAPVTNGSFRHHPLSHRRGIAQKPLTNQEIWHSPTFNGEHVGGLASMNDGEHYTVLDEVSDKQTIDQYSYTTGQKVSTLVDGKDLVLPGTSDPIEVEDYSFSGDEKLVMIETHNEAIYRHSYSARALHLRSLGEDPAPAHRSCKRQTTTRHLQPGWQQGRLRARQ